MACTRYLVQIRLLRADCLEHCRRRPQHAVGDGSRTDTAAASGARSLHLVHHGREVRSVVLVPSSGADGDSGAHFDPRGLMLFESKLQFGMMRSVA